MTRPKALTRAALKAHPLPPVVDGDKEKKGRILIVAGSREVPGSALLTATAAMRAGAGKLRIATAGSIAVELGLAMPEAKVVGLAEARDGGFARSTVAEIGRQAGTVDAVVAGPGLAQAKTCAEVAKALIDADVPIVLDAALLHSLMPSRKQRSGPPPILLPHAGELGSLLGCDESEVEEEPIACGRRAAERYRSFVLVKGTTSHVVAPDGRVWVYRGGAPGLGVSGSGDVLAGIVGGLLARGAEPLSALLWAVLLHGEAGEALSRQVGAVGFLARQIPGEIPALLSR